MARVSAVGSAATMRTTGALRLLAVMAQLMQRRVSIAPSHGRCPCSIIVPRAQLTVGV
jgi:hypothetical protein